MGPSDDRLDVPHDFKDSDINSNSICLTFNAAAAALHHVNETPTLHYCRYKYKFSLNYGPRALKLLSGRS